MAFVVASIIGGGIALAGGATKLIMAGQGSRDRRNEQAAAKAEMRKMKNEYKNLDTSNLAAGVRNPYQNLENTFEDITVNQQQAQFEAQQGQQSRANIMQGLQGAAGGSGIASLAQAMANQGQLSTQKASASIGLQEAQNQQMAAQQGARNQQLEGQGEMYAEQMRQQGAEAGRGLDWQKTSTMYGMSQQRTATANEARRQAKADQMAAVGQMAQAGTQIATAGMKIPKLPGGEVAKSITSTAAGITQAAGGLTKQAVDFYQQGSDPNAMQMDPTQLTGQGGFMGPGGQGYTTNIPTQPGLLGGVGSSGFYYKKNLKINKNK